MSPTTPQILQTTQNLATETLTVEQPLSVDKEGRTLYDSPVSFDANVLLYDAARGKEGRVFETTRSGSEQRVTLTLYVKGDSAVVPNEGARVTRRGKKYIATDIKPVYGLEYTPDELDHTRVRCRDE